MNPIATEQDRRAIAHLVHLVRPDWDTRGIESALARQLDQQVATLAVAALIAAVTRPDQKTPHVLAADGAHLDRARAALSLPVPTRTGIPGEADDLTACATCGASAYRHGADGRRIDCPGYQPAPETTHVPMPDHVRSTR